MKKVLLAWLLIGGFTAFSQQRDSLDIKIGQMLLIGFPTGKIDSTVLDEVRKGKVGSLILFEKNVPPANSFVALKKITWTYQLSVWCKFAIRPRGRHIRDSKMCVILRATVTRKMF